jgi:hypothetical protein
MAKFNEGDAMEGIFCLAAGLYLAYDEIDKAKLNKFRAVIDPQKFADGHEHIMIVKDHITDKDVLSVDCVIRLKTESTQNAFGSDYQILYEHQRDIGDIDAKIQNLVKNIETTNFGRRLLALKNKYVKNNTKELLYFRVEADGIAGETSGGEVKADVDVKLEIRDAKKKLIGQENIPFSIKSKSTTLSNLSPFNGVKKIAASFDIDTTFIEKFRPIFERRAKTVAEKEATNEAIMAMYNELTVHMVKKSNDKNFSRNAVNFIRKEAFGADLADIVDIDKTKIKEIPKEFFDSMVSTLEFEAVKSGNYIKVMLKGSTKLVLFSTRIKIRTSSSGAVERKFYIEVGNMLYKN